MRKSYILQNCNAYKDKYTEKTCIKTDIVAKKGKITLNNKGVWI